MTDATAETVVETRGLTKRFGRVLAVDNLSLGVPRGGVFGLLGPNGSGKTTTMGMLLGLVAPTAGSITLFGREGVHPDALGRIGAIVETPAFYPHLTGRDNLLLFQGVAGRGSRDEVDWLLRLVDLAERANSKFSTYSLGMKQRLGVAYALLGDPALVFLDEPTNGLDPAGMAEVRDLIRVLASGGRTVLLSSHLLHEVEQVCDRVAILSRGKLIVQGRVKELLAQQGGVKIETTDDLQAREVLASLPWITEVKQEDGHLVASAPPSRSWEMTAALAERGVFVSEMTRTQLTLERYFLEVTGDNPSSQGGGR